MAYIQVGRWLGATAREYRGPRPLRRERAPRECAPPSSHKLTGENKNKTQKNNKTTGAPGQAPVRVLELGQGIPDFGMEGLARDLNPRAHLPGRGDCGVTLQLPTPWSPGPHPKGGAAGGRPGASQPPGPPAPVAVVTARANWPVEPAGGSCSDLEGTRTSFSQALGAERWGHPEARAHW